MILYKTNINEDFSGQSFEYSYPISFEKRNKDYLEMNIDPKLTWSRGDSVTITLNLTSMGIDLTPYTPLSSYSMELNFYDFRQELILSKEVNTASTTVTHTITPEESSQYFNEGTYYLSLVIKSDTVRKTLIREDSYPLFVQ